VKAYEKALEAFTAYAKLQDPPIEIVRIPFEGKEIVGYLRLPKACALPRSSSPSGASTAARKTHRSAATPTLRTASATSPSTCRAPANPRSDKSYPRRARIHARPRLHPHPPGARRQARRRLRRILGRALGARLAYLERDRIRGAVVQGGPVHEYFEPDGKRKAIGTREYLFELFEARAAIYGAKTSTTSSPTARKCPSRPRDG